MRAQVLEAFNTPYVLKDIPKPLSPTGKDILVNVKAVSYCHTDAVFASGAMWQDLPRVGSHEFAGVIVATGPDISPSLATTKLPIPSPTTYEAILRSYLEIGASVSRDLISLLAQSGRDEDFQAALGDQFMLVTAFSREEPPKVYAQDRLREYATEVNTILVGGGHFYIYGDTTHMARAANDALAKIIAARRSVDDSEAQSVLKKMRLSRQYQVHCTLQPGRTLSDIFAYMILGGYMVD
ncbi:hypothetical protein BJX66DRAFT_343179 [Aspergillus keveii]|uniref:NADPH--hemoprotein reductase n=1 Tax=Aspergillus keveii TaxID=714993 RepID=A0ABR4FQ43_9EURO